MSEAVARQAPWRVDATLVIDPVFDGDGRLRAWARLPDAAWRALAPVLAGRYDLQVCEFSAYTAYLLGRTGFNHWHCADPELCADELCFFRDGRIELLAQPWNSMLRFFGVEHRLLQDVAAAHPRFAGSVFLREGDRLRVG